jgi:transcriptional regulator with XRE-family HTH domain
VAQIFFRKKLQYSKTLGEKLKAARKKKKLNLAQAEEETKVRLKYLEALEEGDYLSLPADVYALGFLAKYAEFLGLPKDQVLQDFRKEKGETGQPLIPVQKKTSHDRFFLTPRLIAFLGGGLVFLALVGYIFYSVKHFTAAPNLEISSPSTETVIREDRVEVVGKTDIGCSLRINDQTVYIDDIGNFKEVVRLQPGINNIEIRSTNRVGRETAKVVKVLAEF